MTVERWDESAAATYDDSSSDMYAAEVLIPTVDFLADLAPGGRAVEFAIGTGRVALPLRARGLTVVGIDSSPAMIDVLRRKPRGAEIEVVTGDMATVRAPGEFDVVYLVYNTITNLLTQSEQVACFRNAAAHLRPGGRFVVEVFVPDLQRLPVGAIAVPFRIEDSRVGFDTYDLLTQRLVSHHYWFGDGTAAAKQAGAIQSHHRYVWPSELDLMGELAGLTLAERWAGWTRTPFTAESRSHVSVWVK